MKQKPGKVIQFPQCPPEHIATRETAEIMISAAARVAHEAGLRFDEALRLFAAAQLRDDHNQAGEGLTETL